MIIFLYARSSLILLVILLGMFMCSSIRYYYISDTNTIRTSSHSILYDFAYELDLTCYDGGPKNNKTNSVMVQVNFKRMTKTGNSAELSTSSTGAYVGFVFCVVHIIKRLF